MLEGAVAPKVEEAPGAEEAVAAEVAPVAEVTGEAVEVEAVPEALAPMVAEAEAAAPIGEAEPLAAEVALPVEFTAEPEAEAPQRVYSFEEILSEIEVVTGNLKGRYSKKKVEDKPVVILDTKGRKGKKGGVVKDDEVAGKPKAKKGARRQVIADDFDDYTSEAELEAEVEEPKAEEEPE
jgi:hypothetical protein